MNIIRELTNYFLVATPQLKGSFFEGAVTYICDHTHEGAMGIVVNHPVTMKIDNLDRSEEDVQKPRADFSKLTFRVGGPLQHETHFVMHRDGKKWDKTFRLTDELCLTSSSDILKHLAEIQPSEPEDVLMTFGFSGWEAGQLEKEVAGNDWLICPADPDLMFKYPPEMRWRLALELLGIDDPTRFIHRAGHC